MKILVTGKNGQVAQALLACAKDGLGIIALGRPELDITDKSSVERAVKAHKPDIIVNAAAYTAVDKAEDDVAAAFAINRDGAKNVAEVAAENCLPIIHISTDYVFNGEKDGAYEEDDATGPLNVYGLSKLEGEWAVQAANPDHVILRTAWVYSSYGSNFVKTMLKLAETRDEISVVCDQWGTPTSADFIAENIVEISRQILGPSAPETWRGIFHLVPDGKTTRFDYARKIIALSASDHSKRTALNATTTDSFPTKVIRPSNSHLNSRKFCNIFKVALPNWEFDLNKVINRISHPTDARDTDAQNVLKEQDTPLVLVTGGMGYLGRHVVNALLKQGYRVNIATSNGCSNIQTKAKILPFDVFAFNENIFEDTGEPDLVINLAWKDGFSHGNLTHFDFAHRQYEFIHNMLQGGLRHIASIGTMHEVGYHVGAIDENTPTNPINNYGIAKNYLQRAQRQLCEKYGAIDQWLRCYYITGDDEKSNSVFNKILKAEDAGLKEFNLTDGEVLFDFIDVHVLSELIIKVAAQKSVTGIINCCTGQPISLKSKIMEFLELNNLKIKPCWGSFPTRPYDSRAVWGDVGLLEKALNIHNN